MTVDGTTPAPEHSGSGPLLQQAARWQHLFSQTGLALAIADPLTNCFLDVNETFARQRGFTVAELIGQPVTVVYPPEVHGVQNERYPIIDRAGHLVFEAVHQRRDGSRFPVLMEVSTITDGEGRAVSRVAHALDLSEWKAAEAAARDAEAQLRQAQKLEAVGQLAGGIAHDFNNILAGTMMHLGLLQARPGLDPEIRESLKELESEVQRAAGLTRQLLMFSRRSVLDVRRLDLNDVVANLLRMLRRLIGEHIDLRFDGKTGLPAVEADAGMIEQVLMNLVVNARDAMPRGGRITIATTPERVSDRQARAKPERRVGAFVRLSVGDTGCGMDSSTMAHVFEPFFTTKGAGQGTGLGLATAHGIVAQHHGWIEVASEPGRGSTFSVFLPVAGPAPSPVEHEAAVPMPDGGHETILVVEDEAAVRRMIVRSLAELGYAVIEAASGREALRLWRAHDASVDLLFTDMVMPEGMTGLELVERLQRLRPGLKAIISSGYSADIVRAGVPDRPGIVYLPKPYDVPTLGRAIRDCLDRKG